MTELLDIAEKVVGWARDDEQVEVYVGRGRDTDIEIDRGQIETFSSAETLGVGVRVIRDGREGFAFAASFDEEVLADALADARDNSSFAEPDEWNGLAEPDGVEAASIDPWDDGLASITADQKVELALALEKAALASDSRIRGLDYAGYGDGMVEAALASTTGIRSTSRRTAASLSVYAMAGQGDETQTGGWFSVGKGFGDLSIDEAVDGCRERSTRMLGATKPDSRRTTVILDPFVTCQFLSILSATLNGMSVLKGRSLFAERMGEEVASSIVTLVDDPTDERMYTAGSHDGEGLATRRNALIDGGVLRGFVHNAYTGRRSGAGSTGSALRGGFKGTPGVGCRAMLLEPGTSSQAELIANVGDGVLIQNVIGLHSGVNPISGDFSTGAEGLVIRDGQLAEPIREFTIGSTIQRMLQGIVEIGGDVAFLPMSAAGMSIAIADVTISGR